MNLDLEFRSSQFVPAPIEQVFEFFSLAENLETITPPWLNFHVTKKSTDQVGDGTLIDYKLKIHGVPVRWRSRISRWTPNQCFVDEQLKGPYSKWYHLHTFERVEGGTQIGDHVTYRIPFGILGKIFLKSWIQGDVESIFAYRQKKILELFP